MQAGWIDVSPDITQTVGFDQVTGDPIVCLKVDVTGMPQRFLRLNVTTP